MFRHGYTPTNAMRFKARNNLFGDLAKAMQIYESCTFIHVAGWFNGKGRCVDFPYSKHSTAVALTNKIFTFREDDSEHPISKILKWFLKASFKVEIV